MKRLNVIGVFLLVLLLACVSQAHAQQKRYNIAGTWSSNIGVIYTIEQEGDSIEWTDTNSGLAGTGTVNEKNININWIDRSGAQSAKGVMVRFDSDGYPIRVRFNHGIIIFRDPGSGAAEAAATGEAVTEEEYGWEEDTTETAGAGEEEWAPEIILDISGEWTDEMGTVFTFTQSGSEFEWSSSIGYGSGTISGNNLTLSTSGGTTGPINGTITETDSSGRPSRIEWAMGSVFVRGSGAAAGSEYNISGDWVANDGNHYSFIQYGSEFDWTSDTGMGGGTLSGTTVMLVGGNPADGSTLTGEITSWDTDGSAQRIEFVEYGLTLDRAGGESAEVSLVEAEDDIGGSWAASSSGAIYTITQEGEDFTWSGTDGLSGTGRIYEGVVFFFWSDSTGSHRLRGMITANDGSGRPSVITLEDGSRLNRQP